MYCIINLQLNINLAIKINIDICVFINLTDN